MKKYIPFLKTFSKDQLKALDQNGIRKAKSNLFILKNQCSKKIEEIISGDKIEEFEKLLQEKDITTSNPISKSFLEVEKMKIPLIQYCIMKNAIECFKYLLVNGYDDPNKTMEEQDPEYFYDSHYNRIEIKRYEWDCMATAIYFGNKEIIKILEEKGIEKGKKTEHIEAAIFSYRNLIAKEIIDDLNEKRAKIQKILNISLIESVKSNNIKGVELLINKCLEKNLHDKQLNSFSKIKHYFILH